MDLHFTEWAKEGVELAKNFVYKHIKEGELPSDHYISEGARIAQRQIAKGGYRLAKLLSKMWKKSDHGFLS